MADDLFRYLQGGEKGAQILLSYSQAGPGRKTKQGQEEISRNHVPSFFLGSVVCGLPTSFHALKCKVRSLAIKKSKLFSDNIVFLCVLNASLTLHLHALSAGQVEQINQASKVCQCKNVHIIAGSNQ